MTPDQVRVMNAILAGTFMSGLIWLAWMRWSSIGRPRQILWLGTTALLASYVYGAIEAVFFKTEIRVFLSTLGLVTLGMGIVAEIIDALRERRR